MEKQSNVYNFFISSKISKEIATTEMIELVNGQINKFRFSTQFNDFYKNLSEVDQWKLDQSLNDLEDSIWESLNDYLEDKEIRELKKDERWY